MQIIESRKFRQWLKGLRGGSARAKILARINRFVEGLPGDVKTLGGGLFELRIHTGPGYRVYFYQKADVMVILLCGGDKSSQRRDIEVARELLSLWKQ